MAGEETLDLVSLYMKVHVSDGHHNTSSDGHPLATQSVTRGSHLADEGSVCVFVCVCVCVSLSLSLALSLSLSLLLSLSL